jgi:molybdate transport system permease protein
LDLTSLIVSLKLAAAVTFILVIAGAPIAYILAYYSFRGKSLAESLVYLPTALPPTVIGFYMIILMGPEGVLGKTWENITGGSLLFSFAGIAVATAVYSIPFAVQPMKAAFQKLDPRLIESASVLGLSGFKIFFRVVLPNSVSGIVAAAVLVFLHAMGAFGVIVMVGGSIPGVTRVASIAIYEAVETMDYTAAALMSLSFIPVSFAFLFLVNKLNEGR